MTWTLRILLVIVSLLTLMFVMKKVRSSRVKLEDSMVWIFFSVALFLLSVFPGVFDCLAEIAGVYSTVNFVFLFFIFALLALCFSLHMRISQIDIKVRELTQLLAIEKYERYSNDSKNASLEEPDEATSK